MADKRVVVVGTTADYIEIISERFPGRALFVTDVCERTSWQGLPPDPSSEVVCRLGRPDEVLRELEAHLLRWSIQAVGVACFDCESLMLASLLAAALALPFPTAGEVASCRSKYAAKDLWWASGVSCPAAGLVRTPGEAVDFWRRVSEPVVLKPLTGSGSELVFLCETERECLAAYQLLRERLKDHPDVRLYETFDPSTRCDPRAVVAIESYVEGTEYSCDFVLEQGRVSILRIARKVAVEGHGFGTILAYLLPGELPDGLSVDTLASHLLAASRALGLERTLAMADLIVAAGEVYFLEVSPRLGGDCLPELVKASCGFDMLGAALDFAEGKSVEPPPLVAWKQFVGLRLFASCQGEIKRIDTGELLADQRVLRLELKHQAGHKVVLPPSDYGSHLLGHLFFKPHSVLDLETECLELAGRLRVEYA